MVGQSHGGAAQGPLPRSSRAKGRGQAEGHPSQEATKGPVLQSGPALGLRVLGLPGIVRTRSQGRPMCCPLGLAEPLEG